MPRDYGPVEERDGMAVIPRDFFPTMCPLALNDDWAAITIKYRPYFDSRAVTPGTGLVVADHPLSINNEDGRKQWLSFVQQEVLGKRYRDYMTMGWSNGLSQLMVKSTNTGSEGGGKVVDFSFRGITPSTQADVSKILFGDEVTNLVKSGKFEEPAALLFKWCYYLTLESCSSNWAETATTEFIENQKYKIVLGNECMGGKAMSSHGWLRIGRKLATNSFQTTLRRKQEKIWGKRLMTSMIIGTNQSDNMERVDIQDYLPSRVMTDMCRKDKTVFNVMKCGTGVGNTHDILSRKVGELVHWAQQAKLERQVVEKLLKERFDNSHASEVTTSGSVVEDGVTVDGQLGTADSDDDTDDDAVATIVQQEKSVPVHQQKGAKDKNNFRLNTLRGTFSTVRIQGQNASEKETNEKIDAYLNKSREDDEVRSMTSKMTTMNHS